MIMRSRLLVVAFVLVACQRRESVVADARDAGLSVVEAAPSASAIAIASAPAAREAGPPPPHLIWRVMRQHYVEEAGVPREMWIDVQLEVAGKVLGPWRFDAPSCWLGGLSKNAHSVAQLTCYYAGGGEYIDVREKKPGHYVVIKYAQDEGYADEPSKPEGMTTVGTFDTMDAIDVAIVSADGGVYTP